MRNKVKTRRRTSRRPVGRKRSRRSSTKQPAKKRSLFRRALRLVFNPVSFGVGALIFLILFLTATYFWFEYSEKVDMLLAGEVFTHTAGIYSSPKVLKKGEKISRSDLIGYLKSAGYISRGRKADLSRSRYEIGENSIDVDPGNTALVDGKRNYRDLKVKFDAKNTRGRFDNGHRIGQHVEANSARTGDPQYAGVGGGRTSQGHQI